MSPEDTNPYRPPNSDPAQSAYSTPNVSGISRINVILVVASAIGYLLFTVMLVTSGNGDDERGGYLFCGNLPVIVLWIILLLRQSPAAYLGGILALIGQIVILLSMIALGIGDVLVVVSINGAIAAGFVVLTLMSYHFAAKASDIQPH